MCILRYTMFVPNELCKWLRPLERNFIVNQWEWLGAVTRCLRSLKSLKQNKNTIKKCARPQNMMTKLVRSMQNQTKSNDAQTRRERHKVWAQKSMFVPFSAGPRTNLKWIMVRCYTIFSICFDIFATNVFFYSLHLYVGRMIACN